MSDRGGGRFQTEAILTGLSKQRQDRPRFFDRGRPRTNALEDVFQGELNHARVRRRALDDAKRGWRLLIRHWIIELRMVERVEELSAELDGLPLRDRRDLEQRDVIVHLARSLDDADAGVAEERRAIGRERGDWGRAERTSVDPAGSTAGPTEP